VVARDMPFLFASLAGAFSSFGLDILKAEAFSNARGQILDRGSLPCEVIQPDRAAGGPGGALGAGGGVAGTGGRSEAWSSVIVLL